MENPRRHHSFFWPTLLIGVGLVWLLVNLGVIAPFNISALLQLWPLLLIVLGLDILFGRRYAWVGSVFGLLAIGGVIAFLILTPKTGLQTVSQIKTETFTTPVGQASSVNYNFETASEPVDIYALGQSANLMDANISHQGTMGFVVSGSTSKTIHLFEINNTSEWFNWNLSLNQLKWNIGLNPDVPSEITLDGGSGSINADLSGIQLESLKANLGSGSSNFTLPEMKTAIAAEFESGSGSVNLSLPAKTDITLRMQSGSGSVNVSLPSDTAVKIEVMDSGSGSLNLPSNVSLISGDKGIGVWQSDGYDQATTKIFIQIINRGSGSLSIN